MKLINGQKQVEYFGLTLYVPDWVKWIATDANGEVFAYSKILNQWGDMFDGNDPKYITQVDLEGMDWRETLMEVK